MKRKGERLIEKEGEMNGEEERDGDGEIGKRLVTSSMTLGFGKIQESTLISRH